MAAPAGLLARNGEAVALERVPQLAIADFTEAVFAHVRAGGRVSALFGREAGDQTRLDAVLTRGRDGQIVLLATEVAASYPSLTTRCHQVHLFEREIYEQWRVVPEGHPWPKPVRGESPRRSGQAAGAAREFYAIAGDEIHEVAVGPVHAGIIEPGHFRFQCHGETVLHLEIALGYGHRGVERALVGGPGKRSVHHVETLAGDSSVAHATAYAHALEALGRVAAPARAQALRGVALELERLANHAGDLGALAGDVGYLPTQSFCGRLRGEFLNLTASLCGSRFGRGLVRPGGVGFDCDGARVADMIARLDVAMKDLERAVELLWSAPSVMARFEDVGVVTAETAVELGLVGVAARAVGLERDVRAELPDGIYQFTQIPVSTAASGDVFARAMVRWREAQRSAAFVKETLAALPQGRVRSAVGAAQPDAMVATLVEGWRGEVCHVAVTDAGGQFAAYKIVDPSFHNWMGLEMALRGQQISDFPLINKSFNLSYCGHDL